MGVVLPHCMKVQLQFVMHNDGIKIIYLVAKIAGME